MNIDNLTMKNLPLGEVQVIDFTQALAGPYASLVLADLGADVVKIEKPNTGDDSRHWGPPFINHDAAYFYAINRNKRSLAIDLKSPEGSSIAKSLIREADIVVENWRPGVSQRLGLDYASIAKDSPHIIYASLSGFGSGGGPLAGYDQVIQGMSGLMSVTGDPGGPPTKVGVGITDIASGMFTAIGCLGALIQREMTGTGCHVDVAMLDSAVALLAYQATRYFASGDSPIREGNVHNSIAPYAAFETADGYVNICVANDGQWGRFCSALNLTDVAVDLQYATSANRTENKEQLYALLRPVVAEWTSDELLDALEHSSVPAGPIRTLEEVFQDDRLLARGMRMSVETADEEFMHVPGVPWKIGSIENELRISPPRLGEHTQEVLRQINFNDSQIADLVERRIVGVWDNKVEGVGQ